MKSPRVALVYDRVNKFGGAERVLLALHKIWPEAPLYTAVYDKKSSRWADVFDVRTSFLQNFPWARQHHEWYAWATPMAFESFSFGEYDIVISVTSAEAKNIITKPKTLHVCYCLTPTRYLWSGYEDYTVRPNIGLPSGMVSIGLKTAVGQLRQWDMMASERPDYYIAISERVKDRIDTYYHRKTERVIYPPVDVDMFDFRQSQLDARDYYIVVSRLVGYKRVDIVVDAFTRLGWPLVIIGDGKERRSLMARAGANIRFFHSVSDETLAQYYKKSKAFVFAGDEDFGIAACEAQAAGVPVIAYRHSGIAEVVVPGKTGILFDHQTVESLVDSLKLFDGQWYDSHLCRENAERFSVVRFISEMKDTVSSLYNRYI